MANMTKTQIKKKVEALKDCLSDLRLEFEELQSDIEPYEGRQELTELPEARQEWLDNTASTIEETVSSLQEAEDNLEYIEE